MKQQKAREYRLACGWGPGFYCIHINQSWTFMIENKNKFCAAFFFSLMYKCTSYCTRNNNLSMHAQGCLPATMYDNCNQVIQFFMINCIIRLENKNINGVSDKSHLQYYKVFDSFLLVHTVLSRIPISQKLLWEIGRFKKLGVNWLRRNTIQGKLVSEIGSFDKPRVWEIRILMYNEVLATDSTSQQFYWQ